MRAAVLPLLLATGCAGMNNTDRGATAGGLIGAGAGAAIGSIFHAPLAGAAIGGGAGLLTGAAVGNAADERQEQRAVQQAAAVQADAQKRWPTLMDIQQMSASGTSDAIIVNQIRSTGAMYNLRAQDIEWLQQNGVHDRVIVEMQATATRAPVVYQGPPPPPPGVVVVEPAPYVGVGWGYHRHW